MKRSFARINALMSLTSAVLFAVSSCSGLEEIQEPSVKGTRMSIVAEINSTKTVNDGLKTEWTVNDELSAIHNTTGSSTVYNDKFTYDNNQKKFTGSARSMGSTNDWYVVYPYNSAITKASQVPVTVNAAPTQSGANSTAHLAGSDFSLFGKKMNVVSSEDGLNICMENALSVASFTVTNTLASPITVTAVELTSVNPVAGSFNVDLTGETPVWTANQNASKKVTLNVSGNATIAAGATGKFYAGVAPHDIPAGSQLIVAVKANQDGKATVPCYIVKTVASSTAFKAGLQKEVRFSYDENHTTDPTGGAEGYKLVTSEPSDWSGKYIMVSADKKFVFTGDNGTGNKYELKSSDLSGEIITKDCSSYEFTITKNSSNYYLEHGGKYLYCEYGSGGDSSTGMGYSSSQKALSLDIQSDGTFGFWMKQGDVNQYIYYKSSSGYFKFGGSHNNHCVYLYKYSGDTPVVKKEQTITVPESAVTWTLGSTYKIGSSYDPQAVSGAMTTVSYKSSDESVAAIVEGKIKLVGTGTADITATACETLEYKSATTTYTLTVKEQGTGVKGYELITSEPSNWSGRYIIVSSDDKYLFNAEAAKANIYTLTASDFSEKIITKDCSAYEFTITKTGSNYNLVHASKYLYCDGDYTEDLGMAYSTSKKDLSLTTGDNNTFGFYMYDDSHSKNQYLYFKTSGSNGYFKFGASHNNKFVHLYKYNEDIPVVKKEQTITVPESTVTWTLGSTYKIGSSYDPQAVSGAKTTLSYTSSDAAVATIDGGKIKLVGTGSTTITVLAEEDAEYKSATTSYTLTVNPAPVGVKGYELITSEPSDWSGRYIIVSSDDKYLFNAEAAKANIYTLTASDFSEKIITKDCSAYEFTITKTGSNYNLVHASKYLYCDGDYTEDLGMAYSTSKKDLSLTTGDNNTFGFYMYDDSHSKNQYLYFKTSGSNGYFKFGASHNNKFVHLYKYNDGSTPVPPTPTGDKYVKVTSAPASWDGTYLFVDETSKKAFDVYSSSTSSYAVDVTINSDNTIDATTAVNNYALTVSSAGLTHPNLGGPAYDVKNTAGKYIFCSRSDIKKEDSNEYDDRKFYHCFTFDSNGVQVASSGNQSGNTKYYLAYSSSKFNYGSGSTSNRVQLYKRQNGGTTKQSQTVNFENSSVEWTLGSYYKVGSAYDPQTLTGAKTSVTYASSVASVATIVDGQIKIVGPGTTTITGTAEETSSYYSATATYSLTVKAASGTNGYKLITSEPSNWGGRYIIVSSDDKYLFNAEAAKANIYTLTASDFSEKVITKDCSAYEFTITKTGSNYNLVHASKYLYCDGDYTEDLGMAYSTDKKDLSLTTGDNNTFGFYMYDDSHSKNQYLYFKTSGSNGYFKFGASHNNTFVHLYKWDDGSGKQYQSLSFAQSSVSMKVGSTYVVGGTYALPQTVSGAMTTVTYTSSDSNVATVNGTQITIKGTGSTSITANAAETSAYYAGSATYTLTIGNEGAFNLENSSVASYLNDAATSYTDDNYSSKTVVSNYTSGQSATNRKDAPAPVTVSWTSSASGTRTVYVYNNSAMTDLEMSTTTSGNSVDILNLVPNQTYYYKVSTSASTITTGSFTTEGRRRMLKVSDTRAIGHANNCRDLGGLTTTDGKTVKYGQIFRGTNMDATSSDEKDYLAGYMNVGLDVDLRNSSASGTPGDNGHSSAYNPFNGTRSVGYVKGNFSGYISDFYTTNSDAKTNMTNIFTKILSTIKSGKAAYIHCYVGADRTGYVCMLLEAVLGVSPKDCSIDFELTSFSVVGTRTRTGGGNSIGKDGLNYINNYSKGSTFKEKAYNILRDYGVTDAQITDFRNAMLQ